VGDIVKTQGVTKRITDDITAEQHKIAGFGGKLEQAINDISDAQSYINSQVKVGLVEHRDAISKSEGEIVHLTSKLHTAYTDIAEVQDALSSVQSIVAGHGNQLATAKDVFDKSQVELK